MSGEKVSSDASALTRRLRLRPTAADDLEALYAIHGDRDAMRFTWWAPDREALAEHLAGYAARGEIDGFAPWTAELRETGRVVGWGGLCVDPREPQWGPEVIYMLHPEDWGRGLATEIVSAALDRAFGEHRLPWVGAFARPENGASIRVLEKSGFRWVRHVPELERNQYRIDEEAFRACRD